jgi:hypothetical protein
MASALLMVLMAGAIACSEGDARESSAGGGRTAAANSVADEPGSAEPVDSATLLARAATAHWQEVCESDSAAIRHRATVAAADRAAADSVRAADSARVALMDSLSLDTTRAAKSRQAALQSK